MEGGGSFGAVLVEIVGESAICPLGLVPYSSIARSADFRGEIPRSVVGSGTLLRCSWLPLGSGAYVGVDTVWVRGSLPPSFYCLIREQWRTWFASSIAGRKVCCNVDVAALAVVLPKMGR